MADTQGKFNSTNAGSSVDWSEMRRWSRHALDVRVTVKVRNNIGVLTTCNGQGTNISEGGMSLYLPMDLPDGGRIKISMNLPYSGRQLVCDAIVRNREAFRYGLEFQSLGALDREYLVRTCKALSLIQ
jgi:c-di-GMP-binding flagellar brake protein YcgR